MSLDIAGSVDSTCISAITITGGTAPYRCVWTSSLGVPPITGVDIKKNVVPGIYTLMVSDAQNLFAARDFIVLQQTPDLSTQAQPVDAVDPVGPVSATDVQPEQPVQPVQPVQQSAGSD